MLGAVDLGSTIGCVGGKDIEQVAQAQTQMNMLFSLFQLLLLLEGTY